MVRPVKSFDIEKLNDMIFINPSITLRVASIGMDCSHQTLLNKISKYLGMSFTMYKNKLLKEAVSGRGKTFRGSQT